MTRIVIPDGGTIGSASDTDAISIASNGKPTFSAGIANTGTIDAGTLGSSVVFPTDNIVQVQFVTASSMILNTTYTSAEVISKSITPKFSDSKIILSANISGGYNDNNTGITMFYQIDSATEVGITDMAVYDTGAAGNNIAICLVFDANNTTARTYRLRFRRRDSAGGQAYVMFNNALSAMFLMEVKQ